MARPASSLPSPTASPRAQILAALVDAILQWHTPEETNHPHEPSSPRPDPTIYAEDISTDADIGDEEFVS